MIVVNLPLVVVLANAHLLINFSCGNCESFSHSHEISSKCHEILQKVDEQTDVDKKNTTRLIKTSHITFWILNIVVNLDIGKKILKRSISLSDKQVEWVTCCSVIVQCKYKPRFMGTATKNSSLAAYKHTHIAQIYEAILDF